MPNTGPSRGLRSIPPRAAKIKKPARHTRAAAALLASPDTDQSFSDDVEPVPVQQPTVNRKRPSRAASRTARKRMRGTDKASTAQGSRRSKANFKDSVKLKQPTFTYPGNDLPYHVWLRIFEYVAAPLRDPNASYKECDETRRSLLLMARCDRIFFEPALAAIYKCPLLLYPEDFAALAKRLRLKPQEAS
ncbi:uncharacterized protein B0I36DRAFT_334664, partial [Microdochium trichocladiopsis]